MSNDITRMGGPTWVLRETLAPPIYQLQGGRCIPLLLVAAKVPRDAVWAEPRRWSRIFKTEIWDGIP